MEYVQKKNDELLLTCPPPPVHVPSNLRLIVAFPCPSPQFLLVLYKAMFTTIEMSLVRTNGASKIVARAQHETVNAPDRQDMLLTGMSPTHKGRYKHGNGWPWPGVFGKAKIPLCPAVVMSLSL